MRLLIALLLMISFCCQASGQAIKRTVEAVRTNASIKIDGVLDEEAWDKAIPAGDFIQRLPYNGSTATFQTEVRFLYDNTALYVGAMMFDPHPDSIPAQLGLRDSQGLNADYFMLMLCPFNDGLNAFCFQVFVSDVQADFQLHGTYSGEDNDMSWDAVWYSKAKINKQGWVVELRIPYSALRFPKKDIQEWEINCQRDIRRTRENDTWNFVNAAVQGYVNQGGLMQGMTNVKPPLRLSLTPYVSGYMEKNPGDPNWQFSYNVGADLKYGINQSFTMDMTLIPDFGQVPSDDKIYNFTPYEIRYLERRQFFTEGTELFNKSGIFYSRRIGALPKAYDKPYGGLDSAEFVSNNPMQTKLINATKISGRTVKGLGIGVFNAMTANTWATVSDIETGDTRKVLTQGFTNYNMIVFDQNLKNNSFFDILNTNYFMPTEGYIANVSGIQFKFANKKYTYALTGDGFMSQKYYSHSSPDFGYRADLAFGKITGRFLYQYAMNLETPNYDQNDMGYDPVNNKFNNSITLEYNFYKPFWKLLNWYNLLRFSYKCLYDDLKYSALTIDYQTHLNTRKYLTIGLNFSAQPFQGNDYYEPRVAGWMYISPASLTTDAWISTDYRKKFAVDAWGIWYAVSTRATSGFELGAGPRLRVSNRLFFYCAVNFNKVYNDVGYVMDSVSNTGEQVILFGRRDRQTIINILQGNFMFNSSMSIDLKIRHYWVLAPYYSIYRLQPDGSLQPIDYTGNVGLNFNLFNIDLSYIWNFAPGSQLSFMWKNAIGTSNNQIVRSYFDNLHNTVLSPASNSLSIRLLYYLDALYLKRKKKTD
ncbi:MAG: DUF5916 domain-containing protein [Bacteroidetes bacterium]|nr:DUF5916 domain-containing protein [Bacteroidota bacterium]